MTTGGDWLWRRTVARLDQRSHPKWESLSWLALRPVIDSLNDRVNWLAPGLVPGLRQAWLAKLATARPGTTRAGYAGLVDRSDARSFILMGDTGEQDASQYVVGLALEPVMAGPDQGGEYPFALICSDVIYPSGDVNDYVHGFYLPYENLLHPAVGGDAPPPPAPPRIYGLPGNHDWYDGLTGFMHTFCGVDALDGANYGWPEVVGLGPTLREGFGRLLWRRPSPPLDAPLHKGEPPAPLDWLRAERMRAATPGTGQPGPYFAIQIQGLLIVCIDGGIGAHGDCSIDLEQGRWLLAVSARPGPKIFCTGYPLLTNAEWKQTLIDGAAAAGWPEQHCTANGIVADPAFDYVAAIGGDIHNFQHYQVDLGPQQDYPMTYLVAGGGGAYISATHPVLPAAHVKAARIAAAARRAGASPEQAERRVELIKRANARRGGPPTPQEVAAPQLWDDAARVEPKHRDLGPDPSVATHPMIPSPAASLSHFTEQVLPKVWRLIRAIACFAIGGLLAEGLAQAWPARVDDALPAVLLAAAAAVLARALLPRLAPLRRTGRRGHSRVRAYRAGFAVFAADLGAAVTLLVERLGPQNGWRYLAGWAVISATGGLLGWLQRRSGWWREPAEDGKADRPASSLVIGAAGLAVAATLLLLACGTVPASFWILAAGAVLVLVALLGWRLRDRNWWRAWSQSIALATQLMAAALALCAVPGPGAAARPAAVLAGILLLLALTLAATLLAAALLLAAAWLAPLTGSGAPSWRAGVGRSGHLTPGLVSVGVFAGLGLIGWLGVGSAPAGGWASAPAIALATALTLALLVVGVFVVDWLRRWFPGGYRWIATPLWAVLVAGIAGAQQRGSWPASALIAITLVGLLTAITVSLGYLAFLGGHNLVRDWAAHRDLVDRPAAPEPGGSALLLTPEQAEVFLQMRRVGAGAEELPAVVRSRGLFVFPSTDQPQGIIQQKVSEFFSTDQPEFFQHFLTLSVQPGPDGRPDRLDVTPHVVTGHDPVARDVHATISIPLRRQRLSGSLPGGPQRLE